MKLSSAARRDWWPAWPRASLRTYLVAMILLGTLPSVFLMSWHVLSDLRVQQRALDERLHRDAKLLAQGVAGELVATSEALAALAFDAALQRDDVPAFAAAVGQRPPPRANWSGLFVLRPDGQALFDSLGRLERQAIPLQPWLVTLQSGRPVVTDLLAPVPPRGYSTAMLMPVRQGGQLRYVLGAWIDTGAWQQLLESRGRPDAGFVSLFDRQQRIIARAADNGTWTGQPLPEDARQAMQQAASGLLRATRLEGGASYAAWHPVGWGWGVGAGVPVEPLEARARHVRALALGTAAACVLLGVVLALWVARQVTQPLRQLATAGPRRPPGPIVVNEITALRDALVAAEAQEAVARTRLQSKADEFETLFHNIPVALTVAHDPQCRSMLHNAAMDALVGPVSDGKPRMLHRGQPLAPLEQPLQRAAATGQAVRGMELELQFADRGPRHVIAHAAPLLDAAGRPRGAIGALVDISERKLAEARLTHADRRLRESQRLVDLAQEAGHVGFFHYHVGTDTASWTSGHAKLFGLRSKRVEGPLSEWIDRIHPEDQRQVRQALARLLQQRAERLTMEFRVPTAEGDGPRWLSSRLLMTYGEDGSAQQAIGITVDMTEQKQAEQERAALVVREQAARREAEAASRAKDEFLAMLGHELRNPLSAISSAVEVLKRGSGDEALATHARNIIGRQARHLAQLMDDLLDVARVISGRVVLSRAPLELSALVQRLVATLSLTKQSEQHDIQLELQEVWVDADITRIEQVVNNLLTNAIKYTPEGRRIDVRLVREADGHALLQVRDHGLGIPPALLPRIFDLFVQGERTLDRRAGGLGIGLTLVRRLVEQHGGTVAVESSSEGSTFSVRLQAIEPPAVQPVRETARLTPRKRRVLLVEDNVDAMSALRSLLELDGHEVTTATDGVAGLAALLEQRPEVAVIDIGLPGITGYEVAKRSRGAGHAGKLIALSGYGQGRDVTQALKAGFDAHLVKPVDAEALRDLLAQP